MTLLLRGAHLHRDDGVDLLDEASPHTLVIEGHLSISASLQVIILLSHFVLNHNPVESDGILE